MNNKTKLLSSLTLNKFADLLISAKTTLPALFIAFGAPLWMIAWLVPIRESGALLPQYIIGRLMANYAARHRIWQFGTAIQLLSVFAIIVCLWQASGDLMGWAILLFLMLLSLGRAAASLAMKDIQASVATKGERGLLLGRASSLAGLLTLAVALPLILLQDKLASSFIVAMLGVACLLLMAAMLSLRSVTTFVDIASDKSKKSSLSVDSELVRFIIVRGLFVHSALVAPYFMLLDGQRVEALLPLYLAGQAVASLLASTIWGRLADKSALTALQLAGGLALLACIGLLLSDESRSVYVAGALFFLLSVAHSGVRTARKTYTLDLREGQQRTELVAISNTAIGVILIAFAFIYSFLQNLVPFSLVYVMAAMLIVGIILSFSLPREK